MVTKLEKARVLLKGVTGLSRTQIIDHLMLNLSMSKAGASTYYYTLSKEDWFVKPKTDLDRVRMPKAASATTTKKKLITYKNTHGAEPTDVSTSLKLTQALTWYNYIHESEEAKVWLLEYVEQYAPAKRKIFTHLDIDLFGRTTGWIARLLLRGIDVDQYTRDWLHARIDSYNHTVIQVGPRTAVDKLDLYISDIEEEIDTLGNSFSMYNHLTTKQIPHSYVQRIADYYKPWLEELVAALEGSDAQIKEAYRHHTAAWKRARIAFATSMIDDCARFVGNKRKERKPRKKRAIQPASRLKHFKFKAKEDKLKITSVNPETILGATQLFTLNTKNNIMTVFVAKEGGLDVSRMSIANYDEKLTKSKRVGRVLTDAINRVLTGSKSARNKVLDLSSSEFSAVNGRLNTDTVLLKVVK